MAGQMDKGEWESSGMNRLNTISHSNTTQWNQLDKRKDQLSPAFDSIATA